MMDLRADEVGAADLGKRIRFTTTDGALVEDELLVLHAEPDGDRGPLVLFGVRHVRPMVRDPFVGPPGGLMFAVSGPTIVELTDQS